MIEKIGPYILVGTSHVAEQSVEEIKEAIQKYNPEVVGIELDSQRLKSLYSSEKRPGFRATAKQVGAFGALFAILAGAVQKKVAKHLNVKPGVDMKAGYETARDNKIPVALIDIPITHTLKKLSKIPFRKKISMFTSLIFKSFKKEYRNKLKFDIKKGMPEEKQIEEMIGIIEKEIPLLYNILIHQRNVHMCKRLQSLYTQHETGPILAVVGAGHIKGMREILKQQQSNSNEFSFSFVSD